MTKKTGSRLEIPRPNRVAEKLAQTVEVLSSYLTFQPTMEQRKLRAVFWEACNSMPIPVNRDELDEKAILTLIPAQDKNNLELWLQTPAFKEWFLMRASFTSRIEALSDLALDTLEDILLCSDPKGNAARVNAVKTVLTVAGKLNNQGKEHFSDKDIEKMTVAQLDAYILQEEERLFKTRNHSANRSLGPAELRDTVEVEGESSDE